MPTTFHDIDNLPMRHKLIGKLMANTTVPDDQGCMMWTGPIKPGCGYGWVHHYGRHVRAHRLAYEYFIGNVPEGLVLDHLCRNRLCCNPLHLEPVTIGVNIMRGERIPWHRGKTHCKHGHEFTPENTRVTNNRHGRKRQCIKCHNAKCLAYYYAQKAKIETK